MRAENDIGIGVPERRKRNESNVLHYVGVVI